MNKRKLLPLIIAGLLIGLSGCDKAGKVGDAVKDISKEVSKNVSSESSTDHDYSSKVNEYTRINNRVTQFWGGDSTNSSLKRMYLERVERSEKGIVKGDFKLILSADKLASAAEDITKAQEKYASAKIDELDTAAKHLADTINTYLPKWKELEEYNKAKRYEDDFGAKGKELLPNYVEAQPKIKAAYEAFEIIRAQEAKKAKEKQISQLKKEGLLYELYTEEAMAKAEQIVMLFQDEKNIKDKLKIEEANKLLEALEVDLTNLKKEAEEKKESMSMHDSLIRFSASYREFRKDTKDVNNYNSMITGYNSMIESYNRNLSFRRRK